MRRGIVGGKISVLACVLNAADDHVGRDGGGLEGRAPAGRDDEQPSGACHAQARGIGAGEIYRVAVREGRPREGIGRGGMKRLAGHEDRATAATVHDDHHARMLLRADGSVDVDPIAMGADAALYGVPRLIAADGGEEMDLGVARAKLRERDATAAAGDEAWVGQVDDVSGGDHAGDPPERHVLDVSDDGDAGGAHGRWRTTNRARSSAHSTLPRRVRGPLTVAEGTIDPLTSSARRGVAPCQDRLRGSQ